jgi:DNA-directed RNA polymerase specialized sigma24 family protein
VDNYRKMYATCADFVAAFDAEKERFYLLAFLLTTNHQLAEDCLVRVLSGLHKDKTVFTPHSSAWIRSRIVKDVLRNRFGRPFPEGQNRDSWFEGTAAREHIDAVAKLGPVERFVFVLSFLEGYTLKECGLLLNCNPRMIVEARIRALKTFGEQSGSDNVSERILAGHNKRSAIASPPAPAKIPLSWVATFGG